MVVLHVLFASFAWFAVEKQFPALRHRLCNS